MSDVENTLKVFVQDNGKLDITDDIKDHFRWLFIRHCGYWIKLTVTRWRDPLSKKQRGYYRAVVIKMIAQEMGEEGTEGEENVHQLMKAKFNSKCFVGKDGTEEWIPQSTENLNTAEYAEYIEKIRRWAAIFLGIDIPDPNKFHGLGGEGI